MHVRRFLLLCALGALSAFAGDYDSVVDDSVVGYWRFNDPNDYGKDSSGHGSRIVQWNNGASGGVSADWSRGGGCLELPRKGKGTTSSPYTYGTAVGVCEGLTPMVGFEWGCLVKIAGDCACGCVGMGIDFREEL